MRFRKSHGLTVSETILADLCESSFLRLWTYPNLFKKPGKELADLLVVFRDDVLIFSDKSCSYPATGNRDLDWQRWYRRAIAESAHQIHQAERWLRSRPNQIFLDPKCTEPLPIQVPCAERIRLHRICVVTGAAAQCRAETGRESLAIDVDVTGDAEAFTVGQIPNTDWLHVLDEAGLKLVLSELSTVPDVVAYFDTKTKLFGDGKFRRASCEADLLGHYLWHGRSFPQIGGAYSLVPGLWEIVEADHSFQAGRRENQISRFWDGLIEYVTGHYLEGTLELGNEIEMTDYERLLRVMASEPRFHRRILSKAVLERAERARIATIGSLLPSSQHDVVYALLVGRGAPRENYDEYRQRRARELQLRCFAAKAVRPECRYIVGIALDARGSNGGSEDFVLIDTEGWSEEMLAQAAQARNDLGYYLPDKATQSVVNEEEYPQH